MGPHLPVTLCTWTTREPTKIKTHVEYFVHKETYYINKNVVLGIFVRLLTFFSIDRRRNLLFDRHGMNDLLLYNQILTKKILLKLFIR